MILTIDVGNTNIAFAGYTDGKIRFTARIATQRDRTADQYAAEFIQIFSLHRIDSEKTEDAIISSVVPELTAVIARAVRMITGSAPLLIGPGVKSGLNIKIDNPAQLGADLVCTAVGAIQKYPLPCLILDLGTATKISVLDKNGAFLGCTISPGVGISLKALGREASQLPSLPPESPRSAIGTNTVSSIQAGVVLGTAAMLDGLCDLIEKELGSPAATIAATGGLAHEITKHCRRPVIEDTNLIHDGLMAIYRKNRKEPRG